MTAYNKLLAALLGNVVAILIVWLASKGLATCITVGVADSCTIFGFTTAQVTGAAMMIFNAAFVYFFPPNAVV